MQKLNVSKKIPETEYVSCQKTKLPSCKSLYLEARYFNAMLCISRSCCSVNNVFAQNLINSTNVHWKGKETRLSESQLSIIPIANISAH